MDKETLTLFHNRSSHAAKDKAAPAELDLRCFVAFQDGCTYGGKPGPMTGELLAHDPSLRWQLLAVGLHLLWREHGQTPMGTIIVTSEAFTRPTDVTQPRMATPDEHVDMAQDFATNPDSDVREAMFTYVIDHEGIAIAIEGFHYGERGELVWDELWLLGPDEGRESGGAMAEVFATLWGEVGQ